MIRPLQRQDREPLCALLEETAVFTKEEIRIALELMDAVLDHPENAPKQAAAPFLALYTWQAANAAE